MRILTISLLVCLVALSIFDCYSTIVILDNGGTEVNPVMIFLMKILGVVPALILMKLVFLTLGFILALKVPSKVLGFYSTLLVITNIFYIHMLYIANYHYLKMIL